MKACRFTVLLLIAACLSRAAPAQTSPAHGPPAASAPGSRDEQLADYLGLLHRIAPAAEAAARTYLAAVRLRCGRDPDLSALRHAMTVDGGDPLLMGLIRAEAMQDANARRRLVAQMNCTLRGTP